MRKPRAFLILGSICLAISATLFLHSGETIDREQAKLLRDGWSPHSPSLCKEWKNQGYVALESEEESLDGYFTSEGELLLAETPNSDQFLCRPISGPTNIKEIR